jgi:hypothetical protein
MWRKTVGTLSAIAALAVLAISIPGAGAASRRQPSSSCGPTLDPANFVRAIDNQYYPLPVGRVLVYEGIRDGKHQTDTVTVTDQTKVIEGVTATTILDVARTPKGKLLEKTFDWYAQDAAGNVCYLGEDTKAYLSNGHVDTSGSWESGVNGAVPGIIMEADPEIPDAYRQEYLKGEAEDTAWIVGRGGSITVPYGTVRDVLTSLEHTALEPKVVDQKIYAPGLGIVSEVTLTGGQEVAKLVKVTG